MPLTAQLRQDIEVIRNYLFGGGYPDPVTNAEQLAFLFFFYLAEGLDTQAQARARLMKQSADNIYVGDWKLRNPLNAPALGGSDTISRATASAGRNGLARSLVKIWCASCAMRFFPSTPKSPAVAPSTSWMARVWSLTSRWC